MSADTTSQHQNRLPVIPPLQTAAKIISTQPALLTVTHPFIPSQEGNPPHYNPLITRENAASQISPLERGQGCVTPKHCHSNQKRSLKPTDNTSQHQVSRNCIPQPLNLCRDRHRNTPLNPLSRGEYIHHKSLIHK